jgi:hypothetical protein
MPHPLHIDETPVEPLLLLYGALDLPQVISYSSLSPFFR